MMLTGLALGGPEWRTASASAAPVHRAAVDWSVRSRGGNTVGGAGEPAEIFVRAGADAELPASMEIGLPGGKSLPVTAADLRRGVAAGVQAAGGEIAAVLRSEGESLFQARFMRPAADVQPFGLLTQMAAGRGIDPALLRVFAVRGGVRPGDAGAGRAVLLVNDAQFSMDSVPANVRLVVAGPETQLPGLVSGSQLEAPGEGWKATAADQNAAGLPVPDARGLAGVRLGAMRLATLSADWRVLATADGKPWIAAREWNPGAAKRGAGTGDAKPVWLLWLASEPGAETSWPKDSSFVVFFGAWADQALGTGGGGASGIVDWERMPEPLPAGLASVPVRPLAGFAAALAAGLGLISAGWFLWRGRNY